MNITFLLCFHFWWFINVNKNSLKLFLQHLVSFISCLICGRQFKSWKLLVFVVIMRLESYLIPKITNASSSFRNSFFISYSSFFHNTITLLQAFDYIVTINTVSFVRPIDTNSYIHLSNVKANVTFCYESLMNRV